MYSGRRNCDVDSRPHPTLAERRRCIRTTFLFGINNPAIPIPMRRRPESPLEATPDAFNIHALQDDSMAFAQNEEAFPIKA